MNKKISFFSLVILIVAAIDNMKNLPAAALLGSDLLSFFLFAALIFLLPTGLVAAELSACFPNKGGIFHWVERAFNKQWAMAAIWLQWINTMVWYPTMLAFIVGMIGYVIHPELALNKTYLVSSVLILFWGLTWINLKGIQLSSLLNNICALTGMGIPLLLLILLGIFWVVRGYPVQIDFKRVSWIPQLTNPAHWVSLIAIMASFLGIELSSVHVNDIHKPQKNFPRAILFACFLIVLSMGLGAFSIAAVLPKNEIELVSGIMQVFANFFAIFGLSSLTPLLILLIALGSMGTMINWIISPAKGLLNAAEEGFLPSMFKKKNQAGVPTAILISQAVIVSLFCLFFLLEPNVNSSFWFLTALSTELYMIMYILMFCACLRLRASHDSTLFKIPGGRTGLWLTCIFGLVGCSATIIISFFPPENIPLGNPLRYLGMIMVGNLITLSPLPLFYLVAKRKRRRDVQTTDLR